MAGVLVAASGCTTGGPDPDAGPSGDDAQIPTFDAGVDSGTPACEPGMIECDGVCTRVAADSMNCGSCGNVCPAGFSCAVGRCDCAAPMLGCDGLCIDPSSDTQNCGACGKVCASGETCLDGECVLVCEAPTERCATRGASGEQIYVCADIQADPMNCGACNTRCSGGATCQDGRCTCPEGQVNCSGVCTDLGTDASNCGSCLNSCGADGICDRGTCGTCGTGLTACGDPRRCVDTNTSRLHCGACDNTCGPGEGCDAGTCSCLPGFTDCSGLCANLDGDPRNCGGCGINCGRGGTCSGGVCTCAAGATMCGPECAELDTSAEHCGTCDNACAAGEACYAGVCRLVNNSCATALPVTGDLVINDEDLERGGPRPTGGNCGFGSGDQALYYAVTIPAGQEVAVTTSSSGDLVIFEQAACGLDCAIASDFPEALTLSNTFGTSEVTRIVGVRPYSSFDSPPTYDIEFTYSTPVVAPNGSCATATPVTADVAITGEVTGMGGPRPTGAGCGFGSGTKALYYAVTIPPGQEVAVQTSPGGDIVLFEQAACGDTDCAISTDSFPEHLLLFNLFGTSDVTRIVGVRSYSSSDAATYDIDFTYSTPVVAPNASCTTATLITADTTITGEDTAIGGPRPTGTGCGFGSGSKALYYAVTVPAGQEVEVQTTPLGGADLVLFEQAACGLSNCVRSTDSAPEHLTLDNTTGSDMTRIVAVRGYNNPGSFNIAFTYTTPSP